MAKTLITGAASGIGLALAKRLRREGHELVLVDLHAGDPALGQWLAGDVADEGFWSASATSLAGLDHAAVNAGVSGAGTIADLDFAAWREVMAVNLDGAFLTLRAAMRAIRDGGSIVFTASAAGLKAEPGIAAYAASGGSHPARPGRRQGRCASGHPRQRDRAGRGGYPLVGHDAVLSATR